MPPMVPAKLESMVAFLVLEPSKIAMSFGPGTTLPLQLAASDQSCVVPLPTQVPGAAGVGVGEGVPVGVGVAVGVGLDVGVGEAEGVAVGVGLSVAVGVGLAVGVGVGVGLHMPALPALTMACTSVSVSARL